jgi:SAM-dependent methyltransferase
MEQHVAESDWFVRYYGEHYADSVRSLLTQERSEREVEFILRETGLSLPARVLDLACGSGRHALAFAQRGYAVTGIDLNAQWIAAAQAAAAALDATFTVGDMRQPVGGPYDLIASLFHSFGFFSDAENEAMLAGWSSRLRVGGWFALDVWNRDAMLLHWQPEHEWTPNDDLRVHEARAFDPLTGRITVRYTYRYASGAQHEYIASFRVYPFTELRDLLRRAGLTVQHAYGSLIGDPYALDTRRLVLIARKTAEPPISD